MVDYFQMQRTSTANLSYLAQQDNNDNNVSSVRIVFGKMLFFTILMTVAPLASFFISKDYIFEGIFNVSNRSSYTYAAIVAVIVVHIVLITFLFVAFREDIPTSKNTSKDIAKELTAKKDS
jgi:vacuolar ATPase assembly integral membrane protein VMA21